MIIIESITMCFWLFIVCVWVCASVRNLKKANTAKDKRRWIILLIIWILNTIIWLIYMICVFVKYFE